MAAPEIRPPAPHGASPNGPVGGAAGAFEFAPAGFDWKASALATVQKYPIPCLLGAAAVGFFLGRAKGRAIVGARGRPPDERRHPADLAGRREPRLLTPPPTAPCAAS